MLLEILTVSCRSWSFMCALSHGFLVFCGQLAVLCFIHVCFVGGLGLGFSWHSALAAHPAAKP